MFALVYVKCEVDTDGVKEKVQPSTTTDVIPGAQENPSQVGTASWNFGQWVLAIPKVAENCDSQNNRNIKHISQYADVDFGNDIYLPIIF